MTQCIAPGCRQAALAPWWLLCLACSASRLQFDAPEDVAGANTDQKFAAGWDALAWAERIAPRCWGHGSEDEWLTTVRYLAVASVVTGRSTGCAHTLEGTTPTPVVVLPSMTGFLTCPARAEQAVGAASSGTPACDRCGAPTRSVIDRVAALTGWSLIVVAHLCDRCKPAVLGLVDDAIRRL